MVLMAFVVKFHEKKDEIPPGACRPSKKLKKLCRTSGPRKSAQQKKQCRKSGPQKSRTKNNVEKVDPQNIHKSSKINKFIKRPFSRGGIPRFGFLVTI